MPRLPAACLRNDEGMRVCASGKARPRGAHERSETGVSAKMVRLDDDTSNQLFQTHSDWSAQLEALDHDDWGPGL